MKLHGTTRNWIKRMAAGLAATVCTITLALPTAPAQSIDWVTVGDPGNAGQTLSYSGTNMTFGAVADSFRIMKHEVTISQYTAFLNAVAATDTYSLYNANMASSLNIAGISRDGSSGAYTYGVIGSSGSKPITFVSWFAAARFANWMQNGQGSGSTETGAYTLSGSTSGNAPAKNPGAMFYIPTENQWYKAAFYSPMLNSGSGGYYTYATQSNTAPGNVVGSGTNQANYRPGNVYSVTQSSTFSPSQNYLTDVGAFTNSASYYGTFDQSGGVKEWNDLDGTAGSSPGLRGGDWNDSAVALSSSDRSKITSSFEGSEIGFRLASPVSSPSGVPEIDPAGMASVLALVTGALGLLERRRSRC